MTLRLNSPQRVTRLFSHLRRLIVTTTSTHNCYRHFTISATDTKRLNMEKRREQIYAQWSHGELISRILELERAQETVKPVHPRKQKKSFNSSLHSTRHIALKIAYLGANYGGFEYHANNPFSTPTVEEQIFKALLKSRLVPNNGLPGEEETVLGWPGDEAVEYSKCGRTDKGVSAFGQVIGVRVRSNKPLPQRPKTPPGAIIEGEQNLLDDSFGADLGTQSDTDSTLPEFTDGDELLYPQILNRLLPPDIRVLAWCPHPPEGFSARFFCEERRYRYFFTNPPIPPGTLGGGEELLDIGKMQEAAQLYVGDHDFRNFCKLDASKQITRFDRIIRHSAIKEVNPLPPTFSTPSAVSTPIEDGRPKVYYFELHGSAFLWHQVRHMVAILFLIGQGLEPPSVITSLLDTTANPCKPLYEMADDRSLVLWDCIFPDGMLKWVYAGTGDASGWKEGRDDLVDNVWAIWHKARIDELLAGSLMGVIGETAAALVVERGEGIQREERRIPPGDVTRGKRKAAQARSQVIVEGGHEPLYRGRYVPVLQRKRMEDVEVINRRYVEKKGDWTENRNRRVEARRVRARVVDGEAVEGGEEAMKGEVG